MSSNILKRLEAFVANYGPQSANSPHSLLCCYTSEVQRLPCIFCFVVLTACAFDQSNFGLLDDGGLDPTLIDGSTVDSRVFVDSGSSPDAALPDATEPDAAPQPCTQFSEFSEPVTITEVSSPSLDNSPSLTADELNLFFHSTRAGGVGGRDLWMATRSSTIDPFSEPTNLSTVNSNSQEFGVSVSSDGLELYFGSNRSGSNNYDIWRATRTTTADDFATPIKVPNVNSNGVDFFPTISSNRLSLYFSSNRQGGNGGRDIWVATRASVVDEFGAATQVPVINSASTDEATTLSSDELTILIQSGRNTSLGSLDVWMATRTSTVEDFGEPVNLTSINSTASDQATWLSSDTLRLYQSSARTGPWNLYVSTRRCMMR